MQSTSPDHPNSRHCRLYSVHYHPLHVGTPNIVGSYTLCFVFRTLHSAHSVHMCIKIQSDHTASYNMTLDSNTPSHNITGYKVIIRSRITATKNAAVVKSGSVAGNRQFLILFFFNNS